MKPIRNKIIAGRFLAGLLALACVVMFASPVSAQAPATPAPATQPAASPTDVNVHEIIILVVEPGQTHANSESAFPQTLPLAPGSRRAVPAEDRRNLPMGGGLITIDGPENTKLEVSVGIPNCRYIMAYPTPDNQINTITWRAVSIAPTSAKSNIAVPAAHWMSLLRDKVPHMVSTQRKQTDAALFYDVAVELPFPLKIEAQKDGYKVTNATAAALSDVQLIKPTGEALKVWTAKDLAASATLTPAAGEGETATKDKAFDGRRAKLIRAGYTEAEADHAAAALRTLAVQDRFLTAVYTLSDAELTRLLPLTVTPKPTSTLRTAFVVVRNADPGVTAEIDAMIAELGASEYAKRAAATKALATLGGLARAKLQEAVKSKDVEVALRAERLLEAIDPQRTPNPGGGGRRIIRGPDGEVITAGGAAGSDGNTAVDLAAD